MEFIQRVLSEVESADEFEARLQACFEESFESLEDAGLEESSDLPVFGLQDAESCRHGIYSYTTWFYDGDESAFSPF